MLKEQKGLVPWFILSGCGAVLGGITFPAQALLFSRLINVFFLPPDVRQDRADFFSLMFFIVALVNFFGYFAIGWSCNTVRRASHFGDRASTNRF